MTWMDWLLLALVALCGVLAICSARRARKAECSGCGGNCAACKIRKNKRRPRVSGGRSACQKACHCEPVSRLAWQSVSKTHKFCVFADFCLKDTDSHVASPSE